MVILIFLGNLLFHIFPLAPLIFLWNRILKFDFLFMFTVLRLLRLTTLVILRSAHQIRRKRIFLRRTFNSLAWREVLIVLNIRITRGKITVYRLSRRIDVNWWKILSRNLFFFWTHFFFLLFRHVSFQFFLQFFSLDFILL